ncbi:MAG: hypothetical protein ACM3X1_03335 [Ignavibacteriales bacterium]
MKGNTQDSLKGYAQHQEETSVDGVSQPLKFMQEHLKLSLRNGNSERDKCNK